MQGGGKFIRLSEYSKHLSLAFTFTTSDHRCGYYLQCLEALCIVVHYYTIHGTMFTVNRMINTYFLCFSGSVDISARHRDFPACPMSSFHPPPFCSSPSVHLSLFNFTISISFHFQLHKLYNFLEPFVSCFLCFIISGNGVLMKLEALLLIVFIMFHAKVHLSGQIQIILSICLRHLTR